MQRHDDALGYASSSRGPRARVSDQITKCSFLLGKPKPKKKKQCQAFLTFRAQLRQ